MSLYGGTNMAAQYQLFLDGTHYKFLPRPYQNSKPGACVLGTTNSTWFIEFVQNV